MHFFLCACLSNEFLNKVKTKGKNEVIETVICKYDLLLFEECHCGSQVENFHCLVCTRVFVSNEPCLCASVFLLVCLLVFGQYMYL